ncbi:hypothetical protein [Bacillus sp. D48C]
MVAFKAESFRGFYPLKPGLNTIDIEFTEPLEIGPIRWELDKNDTPVFLSQIIFKDYKKLTLHLFCLTSTPDIKLNIGFYIPYNPYIL